MRRVAEIRAARPVFADTIGVLTSWAQGVLIVTRRDGEAVEIAESTLAAGKVVPPAPVRRRLGTPPATADELRVIADHGWPAPDTEALGGWLLRAAGGFTRRANSALVMGDPGLPAGEALDRVTAWYRERGLPGYAQVVPGSAQDAVFAEHGWSAEARILVRTAPLAPVADGSGAERVVLSRDLDAGWLARYHRAGNREEAARAVLTAGPSVWFATVPDPDGGPEPAAVGRCVVEGRWAMFAALETDPARRRQGLATAVTAALARRALDEGATGVFLHVEADNPAAAALYDALDFTAADGHHYRRAPGDGSPTGSGR